MIYDNILKDIKTAMLAKDGVTRDCLRCVVSEIKNQTVNAGKEITEDICLKVVQKIAKQHTDSINQFKSAGRMDLAEKELAELGIIQVYLPKMKSKSEIISIVDSIISENKLELIKKNMGLIMKSINSREDKVAIDKKIVTEYLNSILK